MGFHDEALKGRWQGHRSSRLGQQWRIIYQVAGDRFLVKVFEVTAHDHKKNDLADFVQAGKQIDVSVGESVRILRELQELSQNELANLSGIPQSTISAIENDRLKLGVERAKVLARALGCHPAVLVFPGWELETAA